MNHIIKVFVLLSIFFINTLYSKTIKISVSNNISPYFFIDKNNENKGLLVDYWTLWAKKVDVDVKFILMSKKESFEALENKEADIHAGSLYVKNRENYLDYLGPISESHLSFYINRKNLNIIHNVSDLNGKNVAVIKDSYSFHYSKKNHSKINIKQYDNYSLMINAMNDNKVDAIFAEDLMTWYALIKSFNFVNIVQLKSFDYKMNVYAGVRKDDNELIKLVLKGINKISNKELIGIEDKWIIKKNLKYFLRSHKDNILTNKEKEFLQKNPIMQIAILDKWKKYSFRNKNNKLVGYHIDLLKMINKNMNTNFTYKVYDSWSKAYNAAKNSEIDGIFGLSWSKEREEFFSYTNNYLILPTYLIIKENDYSIKNIDDLENKIIASVKDVVVNSTLENRLKNVKFVYSEQFSDKVNMLTNNKADAFFTETIDEKKLKKFKLKIASTIYLKIGELSIGSSKNNVIFASILKKAINSLSKEQKDLLKNKWLKDKKVKTSTIFTKIELDYIKKSKVLKVGVDDWKPILFSKDGQSMDGISADIMKRISQISGLQFQVFSDNWSSLLEKFKKGELDILPDTVFLKERLDFGLFTPTYLDNISAIFINKSNNTIKSLKDLEFKRLAIQKGFSSIIKIKKNFPNIKIIEVSNLNESIKLLLNKEVDAFYAFDLTSRYILDRSLIKSIKTIYQQDIKNEEISIFSRKNDYILNSILKKSLSFITLAEKQNIMNKWVKLSKIKKEVNIIFGKNREPYTIENSSLYGFEFDLVKYILNKMNIKINNTKREGLKYISNEFRIDKKFDMAITVKKEKNDFFYSDNFISFENAVITRSKDNIMVNGVHDLKNKKISSFDSAKKYLGVKFKDIVQYNKNYKEYKSQKEQVKNFLDKKSDIIIIDINIFKWYLKEHSINKLFEYKFDYIFKGKNNFSIVFRDINLRNKFNIELQKIKDSGVYQEIINNYIKYDIKSKKSVSLFLSSLLGKSIYENKLNEIEDILQVFLSLSYIKKIEVFNLDHKKLYSSSNLAVSNFFEEKSFYDVFFTPKNVGYIRIYFNENHLITSSSNNSLIPNIDKFKNLKEYAYFKTIYKKFDYYTSKINLTKKELEYIKNNPIIRYSEVSWEPLVFIDENKDDKGLLSEYKKIIENRTKLIFKHIKYNDWEEVISSFKNNDLDILLSYNPSEINEVKGLLSKKYESFNYVIVTNENASFSDNISDLNNKTIALQANFSVYKLIEKFYPNIKIIKTKTVEEAFKLVSKNEAYATIEHYAISSYNIKNFYSNLKIAGVLEKKYDHHFLLQDKNTILLSIMNKVISSITLDEKNKIRHKWINNTEKIIIDYTLVYELLAVFVFILIIVFFFINKLNKAKKVIEGQKKNLETLFLDTVDAVILVKNKKYVDVNNSLLKLFKYKTKEEFLSQKPGSMAPKYQISGELSVSEMNKHFEVCYEKGTVRFQWLSKNSSGEIFWVEFVATKLKYSNETIIHMLCRDISKSKMLELELKEQKEVFETLFNDSADGVALLKNNQFIDCNSALLKMLEFKNKSDLINKYILDISPEFQENGKLSKHECDIKTLECRENGWSRFEWIHFKSSGVKFWVEVVLTNIKLKNENIIHLVWRNISATKRLQKQIKKRTQDLEDSNEELQSTIHNLKQTQNQLIASEKMAALGGLVAGVAHEINTPVGIGLTGISHLEDITKEINIEYENDEMSQENFEEYLKTSKDLSFVIHKNLEKAASLVKSFKQVAVDQSSEEKREFNLKEYLDEILQSIHAFTKKRNIKIEIFCSEDIKINSYAGAYSQIITNLIMNSLIHGFKEKEEGNISIHVEKNSNELKIVYKDTGIGIKKEFLNKIFDPFFTTNRDNGGSGLGLNIIYNIITSTLNGNIKCISQENHGVEFIIIIKV